MGVFNQILQFLLSISILVLLHEFGHYIVAKYFKTRVEKFYLFFNPWFSLFKFKRGETEYGIGWLPLGGYVKISGMIDESMDKEQLKKPPQPYEFRSKPPWQRFLMIIAGVVLNVILGVIIYVGILYTWGEKYLPPENAKYGIVCDSLALEMGLKNGDKILTIDNQEINRFSEIESKLIINENESIQVEREGQIIDILIPKDFKDKFIEIHSSSFKRNPIITLRRKFSPLIVGKVTKGKDNIADSFLKRDDEILSVNGLNFKYIDEFSSYLKLYKNENIRIEIKRNNKNQILDIPVDNQGYIGFSYVLQDDFEHETKSYSLMQAIPAGINYGYKTLVDYIRSFRLIFTTKSGYRAVGGFVTIGSIFPEYWNWKTFWHLTAFLSIILAFINILPIPALDGGHAVFILYEMITNRAPSQKVMEFAQIVGIILLIALLIFANGNDIIKWMSG